MRLYITLVFCCISALSVAQLPLSLEFEKAVAAKTRTLTGEPGPAYFQNRSDYRIRAAINPRTSVLTGAETVTYTNNSPSALPTLVIRLYQDILKRGFKADERVDPADQGKGVEIDWLVLNGDTVALRGGAINRTGTNLFLTLPQPLQPGQSVTLDIGWRFRIPRKTLIRMGVYSDTAMFVAYWYPQVAVFDDIDGWDQLNYGGMVEFYNDFGNFDVEITVPDRYLVWSTGVWQNPEQCLAPRILERYRRAQTADTVVQVVGASDYLMKSPPMLPKGSLTYTYKAEYVPDFAFCLSDYYHWDASSAVTDASGRRVYVEAVYNPEAADFPDVAGYAKEIIEDLSTRQPGVAFPYPKMTIFQGEMSGGGMEYPMMVNDAASPSMSASYSLTYHEIAHTYFPFYMGINEKKHAWMDEGWASFFPEDKMLEKGYADVPLQWEVIGYARTSGTSADAPLMSLSHQLRSGVYFNLSYSKAALAYWNLREVLGQEVFLKGMQQYMANWNGKHPTPYDFFHSFNTAAGEDLSWYWKPWFFETLKADLSLVSVESKGKKATIVVGNASGLPLPVRLRITYKGGREEVIEASPAVWKENPRQWQTEVALTGKLVSVVLGEEWIPDQQSSNNRYNR